MIWLDIHYEVVLKLVQQLIPVIHPVQMIFTMDHHTFFLVSHFSVAQN